MIVYFYSCSSVSHCPRLRLSSVSLQLSSMKDTIVHVQSDHSFSISVQNRLLPDSHRVYKERAHRVAHLSQVTRRGGQVGSTSSLVSPSLSAHHFLIQADCFSPDVVFNPNQWIGSDLTWTWPLA